MYYVYRYVGQNGAVLYVGITNNMKKRVYQHTRDKLAEVSENARIEYFSVKYREDADLLETYLISYYKSGQHFNVSKTKKGDVSFLGDVEAFPWAEWKGEYNETSPFVNDIGKRKTKFVYNPVSDFASMNKATDAVYGQILYSREMIDSAINDEKKICDMLNELTGEEYKGLLKVSNEKLLAGIDLHKNRLYWLKELKRAYCKDFSNSSMFQTIANVLREVNVAIQALET